MLVANLEHSRVNTCSLYASPTGLSPYLRFGCLSCRVLYYNLRELYMKVLWMQRHNKLICSIYNKCVFDHQSCHKLLIAIFSSFLCYSFTLSFCTVQQLRKRCSPPLSLFGQLLWREFFYTAATNNPNFDRMEGNPICVQVGLCVIPFKKWSSHLTARKSMNGKLKTKNHYQAFFKLPSQSKTSTT